VAARTAEERVAAQMALADLPLDGFRRHLLVSYEADEVTRLIVDNIDEAAFRDFAHLTVASSGLAPQRAGYR